MEGRLTRNSRALIVIVAIVIVISILMTAFTMALKPALIEDTTPTIIFQDDFENSTYVPMNALSYDRGILDGLFTGDDAFSNNNSWDWWGVNNYRAHNGTKSLWCAQYGDNSKLSDNASTNVQLHKVDEDMFAYWEKLFRLANYSKVTLSFWFWLDTPYTANTTFLIDELSVLCYNGTGGSGVGFTTIWNRTGKATWTHVEIEIPTNHTLIGFYYIRGSMFDNDKNYMPNYPAGEGAYIDDIKLIGYKDPVPERPIRIDVTNDNDRNQYYGGNPATNGGLSITITLNGKIMRSVFMMPSESMHFYISTNDLPITMSLKTSSGIRTYYLDNSTVFENEIYSYAVHSTPHS